MFIYNRNIRDPSNVHLLYDILDFKPKEIHKAVLFSTNNALVCESQDDANRVAYDLEPGQRFDVCKTSLRDSFWFTFPGFKCKDLIIMKYLS